MKKKHYKYLIPALICKIIGAIGVCIVYSFYYKEGGDAINYYLSAKTYVNVLYSGNLNLFYDLIHFSDNNISQVMFESGYVGEINFSYNDNYALFTVVLTIPFCLLGAKSLISTTILLASVSFIGLWKLYEVFIYHFPHLMKQFAIAIFFVPSVFFWGSGLL